MYRYSNGQISLADFKQPVGMNLKESNRWVKKAQTIPWPEIEKRYAALFTNHKGNVAKSLRLALGACIIQAEYGISDEETALMIQENPYLQYFCGYPGYDDDKLPFDPSLMVYFRKRLTPEILGEINEMIVRDVKERQAKATESNNRDDNDPDGDAGNNSDSGSDNHDSDSNTGGNSGTMIVDATCAPSHIRYPQDVSLLNEARENAEKLVDVLHDPAEGKKPRTYRKRARKDYLKYTRSRKHTAKTTRKAIGKQLSYLRRDLEIIDVMLSCGKLLNTCQTERLSTIRTIYEQQKYMYDNHTHTIPDRIVSVSQPFVRPIVRGKAGKPVEFGAK
ncbi:MAG: IS5 family transposase, partial [Eubacteriales bacterium]